MRRKRYQERQEKQAQYEAKGKRFKRIGTIVGAAGAAVGLWYFFFIIVAGG